MSYTVIACIATRSVRRFVSSTRGTAGAVTVLKPLCGADPDTYECLRSFCDQSYPEFQVVFGVRDLADPAVAIVKTLQREFPQRDLRLVVDRRQHGSNRKLSNLINMMAVADHDLLVLADSDVRVRPDYLEKVVTPLLDTEVGIVTCAYRGVARPGLWSFLGSMYINEWFMPSVQVAAKAGSTSFAFGASIAIRREVLTSFGGFMSLANQLADDYRLGESTRRMGLRTVLSDVEVETYVGENSLGNLVRHELRWLRTIRALRPKSYGLSFITFGLPLTVFELLLSRCSNAALVLFALTVIARVMLHVTAQRAAATAWTVLLIPLRDFLGLALWGWSFATRQVQWRDDRYEITHDGSAQPVVRI